MRGSAQPDLSEHIHGRTPKRLLEVVRKGQTTHAGELGQALKREGRSRLVHHGGERVSKLGMFKRGEPRRSADAVFGVASQEDNQALFHQGGGQHRCACLGKRQLGQQLTGTRL